MKKTLLWSVLTIMMVALMSVGFVSCGSDDNGGGRDAALVGKWYNENTGWTAGWDFRADGKCYYGEWTTGQAEKLIDVPGIWTTSGNTLTVTWTDEEGTDIDAYTYTLSENNKQLLLTNKKGKQRIYVKQ